MLLALLMLLLLILLMLSMLLMLKQHTVPVATISCQSRANLSFTGWVIDASCVVVLVLLVVLFVTHISLKSVYIEAAHERLTELPTKNMNTNEESKKVQKMEFRRKSDKKIIKNRKSPKKG